MKKNFVMFVLLFYLVSGLNAQAITNDGHTEHFVAGVLISGTVSYFVYKKTENKWKAYLIGAGSAIATGLLKEFIDPYIGGQRTFEDFAYSSLGGFVGASIVIPLKPKKTKESEILRAAFK
jgi:hypothetical protein